MGVEYILKNSLLRKSLDNVTVVVISFTNFKHTVFGQGTRQESVEPEATKVIERTRSANLPKYDAKKSNTRSQLSTSSG
jgi:hypothetical protein